MKQTCKELDVVLVIGVLPHNRINMLLSIPPRLCPCLVSSNAPTLATFPAASKRNSLTYINDAAKGVFWCFWYFLTTAGYVTGDAINPPL